MKREAARPTFDTPSRTIVIEPLDGYGVPDPHREATAANSPPFPPERDDDARTTPA
jgi:hypothetical protein